MARIVIEPQFCPLCGARVEAVRYLEANMFEMGCENCGHDCVVLSDDRVKLPDPSMEGIIKS